MSRQASESTPDCFAPNEKPALEAEAALQNIFVMLPDYERLPNNKKLLNNGEQTFVVSWLFVGIK